MTNGMQRTLVRGISTLLTGEGPLRGPIARWSDLGALHDAAVVVAHAPDDARHGGGLHGGALHGGTIAWLGSASDPKRPAVDAERDLGGAVVLPGLVDAHTHAVFAGDRAQELMLRLGGASYQEIAASGGGIVHTMAATRAASPEALRDGLLHRLREMAAWGARVVEVKTGYGLDLASELRSLDAIAAARAALAGRMTVVATAMPAHAVPPEFAGRKQDYVALCAEEILPAMAAHPAAPAFVDVFVEAGYFDVADAERLAAVGAAHGMRLKAHVDEFERVGGLRWAIDRGATSVEHLLASDPADLAALAASETVAVALPLVSVFLGQPFAAMRALVDAGGLLAVATDCNPGSSMSTNLLLAAQMAVFGGRLTPAEVVRALTRGGARALGCPGGYDGRLRVGGPFVATAFAVATPDALLYELGAPPRAVGM
ncbi:MAG: imidazolonepropionase [Deltaproteobacteria bacterium]|nr:imidazolonepropionase [Deltaproteobacteria bacterium]